MINFNSLKAGFKIDNPVFFKQWIRQVLHREGENRDGEIQYIFCDDTYLLEINQKYLNHDTYTDIITFPLNNAGSIISGEIYISIDRVEENASKEKQEKSKELARVMVHGILHLLGYNDASPEEKLLMRQKEDYYLNLLPQ